MSGSPQKELTHKVGEHVFAKWPNSNLWFRANVLSNKDRYMVQFFDGTIETVSARHVSAEVNFTRTRSKSRTRSRSRSRSRGRSPSRTKAKTKQSPSPARSRTSRSTSRSRTQKQVKTRAETPTRQSARIASKAAQVLGDEAVTKPKTRDPSPAKKTAMREVGRDFGGPVGTLLMTLFLPIMVVYVNAACSGKSCELMNFPKISMNVWDYLDGQVALVFLGFVAFQVVLSLVPVGQVFKGSNGLEYRLNGFFALVVTMVSLAVGRYRGMDMTYIQSNLMKFIGVTTLFSFVMSVLLYLRARNLKGKEVAPTASGNPVYDFFMGRELNPRCGPVDLKSFFELRVGMMGWAVLDICMLAQSASSKGGVNPALALCCAFHLLYIADCMWFERCFFSTLDVTTEGFGFMLAFGDIVWVPFIYSFTARFINQGLAEDLSWYCLAATAVLCLIGYVIFRGSNSQKDDFRNNPYDPKLAHLESIPTSDRRRLLCSGWWGLCRKPNYLGDLIMAFSWSFTCGLTHAWPYFYPVFLTYLLVHRCLRDDTLCRQKHGAAWDRYCQRVKYRIVPYVF